jgi:hypothetical protein
MANSWAKAPKLSMPQQHGRIRAAFPGFTMKLRRGGATWTGTLQPRLTSPAYRLEVSYRLGHIPTVRVVKPEPVQGAPHRYPDGSLCLYWPKEWRWAPHEAIAETLLPWAATWLWYYELWRDTGDWLGPTSHASPKVSERHGA